MAIRRMLLVLLAGCCVLSGCAIRMPETPAEPSAGSAQTETPATQRVESSAAPQDTASAPLAGVVICLDPGHGITDASAQERISPLSEEMKPAYVSGAVGASQTEEEVNLVVAQLTETKLAALGAQVVLTRTTHQAAVSNQARAQIANAAGADLCIRIHADGSEDPSVDGMSMQVPAGALLGTPSIASPSERAGAVILAAVIEMTGAKDRGLVPRSDLTGFNWSEVPCILLEMGFLSNEEEEAALASDAYRQAIADGIAVGVCRWIDTE